MSDFDLPTGWLLTSLGEIADWGSGGTPSRKTESYYGGTIPWVKTGDLGPRVLTQASEFITEQAVANSSAKFFPKGSVAIAMYGATIGKTSILGIDATTNQACGVGNPIKGVTFTEFLYYMLCNEKDNFIAKGKGGAQPNISQALIKEHEIALPPLAEQQQIAQKLDELLAQVDTLKTRLDAIPKILKRFRQSVLAAAVCGRLTEEWRESNEIEFDYVEEKLSSLINEMRNGLSTKPNEQGLGVPILRISSVRSLFVDQVDVRFLELDEVEVQRYSLKPEDLLFTRYNGSLEFVGVCGQVRKLSHENLVYPDKLIRVRVNKEKILPSYLEFYCASSGVRQFIMSLVKSTSGQKGISGQDLKDMSVYFPSIKEQAEIVCRVEQLFAYADQIEQRVKDAQARVNHLTQSILAKAFRGELTADWRTQNPELISGENSAAALLERIRVEREKVGKTKRKVKA